MEEGDSHARREHTAHTGLRCCPAQHAAAHDKRHAQARRTPASSNNKTNIRQQLPPGCNRALQLPPPQRRDQQLQQLLLGSNTCNGWHVAPDTPTEYVHGHEPLAGRTGTASTHTHPHTKQCALEPSTPTEACPG